MPNPVELDVFNPSNLNQEHIAAIRRQYGVADDETLVSFCGRLGKEKSVDVLLDNWAKDVYKRQHLADAAFYGEQAQNRQNNIFCSDPWTKPAGQVDPYHFRRGDIICAAAHGNRDVQTARAHCEHTDAAGRRRMAV